MRFLLRFRCAVGLAVGILLVVVSVRDADGVLDQMATDFWASSHKYVPFTISLTFNLDNISRSKRWVIDRATLKQARAEDLQYVDCPEHIDFLNIYFANRRTDRKSVV